MRREILPAFPHGKTENINKQFKSSATSATSLPPLCLSPLSPAVQADIINLQFRLCLCLLPLPSLMSFLCLLAALANENMFATSVQCFAHPQTNTHTHTHSSTLAHTHTHTQVDTLHHNAIRRLFAISSAATAAQHFGSFFEWIFWLFFQLFLARLCFPAAAGAEACLKAMSSWLSCHASHCSSFSHMLIAIFHFPLSLFLSPICHLHIFHLFAF